MVINQQERSTNENAEPELDDNNRRKLLAQSTFSVATCFGLNFGTAQSAAALGSGLDSSEVRRIEIFEKVAPSVVFIDTFTERRDVFTTNVMEVPLGTGSGFVWDYEGHIITNFHVVRDAKFAQVGRQCCLLLPLSLLTQYTPGSYTYKERKRKQCKQGLATSSGNTTSKPI